MKETHVLNLDVRLQHHEKPYLHHTGDGLLSEAALKQLNSTVPDRALYSREIKEGAHHRKQYHMWRCEPALEGRRTELADRLTEPWSDLVDDILSDEYRAWLSDEVSIDLRPCPVTVGLYVFGDGDYTTTDTGKLEKALTFALYLNEHWDARYGGRFQAFTAKDAATPAAEVVPIGGRCVMLTPGPGTFHRIEKVDSGGKAERLLMMVEFWRP
jgi:hypothetical protein